MKKILIRDQAIGGATLNEIEIQLSNSVVTVKDIIIARVKQEVMVYNKSLKIPYLGLVIPDRIESVLNNKNINKNRIVDFEKQSYVALDGFLKNQFFIIVNDKQVENIEDEINVKSIKNIDFIKLTQLVGG